MVSLYCPHYGSLPALASKEALWIRISIFFRRNLPEPCSGTSTYGTRLGIQSKEINQSKQRPWVVCGSREDGIPQQIGNSVKMFVVAKPQRNIASIF